MATRAARRGRRRREVLGDRNFDHDGSVRRQCLLHRVADLLRTLHVHPSRAVHLGQLVEARVEEVDTDVAGAEVALLLAGGKSGYITGEVIVVDGGFTLG